MNLEEYQTAKAALETGASLSPDNSVFVNLIKKCDERIAGNYILSIGKILSIDKTCLFYGFTFHDLNFSLNVTDDCVLTVNGHIVLNRRILYHTYTGNDYNTGCYSKRCSATE